ncbi:MAG: dialkylresorcinol condensing enzyme [Acidiferrobacter sp.]
MSTPQMGKRLLVVHYSQTGQLTRAVDAFLAPLKNQQGIEIVEARIAPRMPYRFPWRFLDFLDVFPESVYMDPPEMAPATFNPDEHFDLIILAYQVWFLSPSLPMTGFLYSESARVLAGKPVITLIACRNMWLTAQAKMVNALTQRGAYLLDNVVLVDSGPAWSTFITTPRWLLTGRKGPFWKIFPSAGVSTQDIEGAVRFGRALRDALPTLPEQPKQALLYGLGAVHVDPRYIASERIGHRSFLLWGRLLRAVGPPNSPWRRSILVLYALFLTLMIMTVVPITLSLAILLRPFLRARLKSAASRLEGPSGSNSDRSAQYL